MFNRVSKFLFWTVIISGILSFAGQANASCGCPANVEDCACSSSSPKVVYPSVQSDNCSAPMPVADPVAEANIATPPPPPPCQQKIFARPAPKKVEYLGCADEEKENRLAPLSREEIAEMGEVVTVGKGYKVSYAETPKTDSEFVMSSRSERQKLFDEDGGEPCKDGSIFGGRPCKSKDKDGSIFGGGPCKTCNKNGSIFGGGPCKTCTKNGSIFGGEPCKTCKKAKKCAPCKAKPAPCPVAAPKPACVKQYAMQEVVRNCSDLAPFSMEWVDFRINRGGDSKTYSRNLGNYRFRIFGCRRNTKNAILNEGRIIEKDMNFGEIFTDMVSDCYRVVTTQQCIDKDTVLPEYVLTAEITDYFMNVCDEYNWDEAKMEGARNGSSEMSVTWRLMDASKTNVLWKGETKGYAELVEGEYNGEMVLIQRAFADAADNLRYLPGFEDQLAVRVSPEEMELQRQTLIEVQKASGLCQDVIIEDSGSVSTGFGMEEGWIEVKETPKPEPTPAPIVELTTPAVTEASGIVDSTVITAEPIVELTTPVVTETSGFEDTTIVSVEPITPVVTEASGFEDTTVVSVAENNVEVVETPQPAPEKPIIEVPAPEPEPVVTGALYEADKLCIVELADNENLTVANLDKVKNDVVSVTNTKDVTVAGLLISEQFIMTTADVVNREDNKYTIDTRDGKKLQAKAFRVNPRRNTALLVLSEQTEYTPLALAIELPAVGKGEYNVIGLTTDTEENKGNVTSYRYAEDGTANIVSNNFDKASVAGGVLVDARGKVTAIVNQKQNESPYLFLPIETTMRSLGVEICGKAFPKVEPKPVEKVWRKPVSTYIDKPEAKAPEAMPTPTRK